MMYQSTRDHRLSASSTHAVLEGIAYQVADLVSTMEKDLGNIDELVEHGEMEKVTAWRWVCPAVRTVWHPISASILTVIFSQERASYWAAAMLLTSTHLRVWWATSVPYLSRMCQSL